MQNIPLTYLATVQPEEVYIQQPMNDQMLPEQPNDNPPMSCALDETPVSKPGHLGYKGWKAGSIL